MPEPKTLRLILGDQLNAGHTWFQKPAKNVVYTMMEVRQETDAVTHHIQKVVGFFGAMRRFARYLESCGHRVMYVRLDDPENTHHFEGNVERIIRRESIGRFEYQQPDEYRLDGQLARAASRLPVTSQVVDTQHFLTRREDVKAFFTGKKRWLMESFYRHLRKRHGILMEADKPAGGRWNYDRSNRGRYDGNVPVPRPKVFRNNVADLVELLQRTGVKTLGDIDAARCIWPLDRGQALEQLSEFLRVRLPYFGTYQDAMTSDAWSLFHSRLSFALNTKMLHPLEVVQAAVARASESGEPNVGIEQLEGFVRQVLGWREYMRGIYWAHMPGYEKLNFFGHVAPLPAYYWTADTKMNCVRIAVGQSLKLAYAHHIQRLMVTGNFALLAGIHPDQVDAWYLGIYIDAVQWVEIVNTRGMSQFADGGLVATKPYVSSANYIRNMSDYCDRCHYDHGKKTGDRACPFNSLFWDFLARHREKLQGNPRIGAMYRNWDRMTQDSRSALLKQARQYRENLEDL